MLNLPAGLRVKSGTGIGTDFYHTRIGLLGLMFSVYCFILYVLPSEYEKRWKNPSRMKTLERLMLNPSNLLNE